MQFTDFLASALAIQPVFDRAGSVRVGQLVLTATHATRQAVRMNTNLGTLLLLAPLATAVATCRRRSSQPLCADLSQPSDLPITRAQLRSAVAHTLDELDANDSAAIYEAILLANPGGLGTQTTNDVSGKPPANLRSAMAQAASNDAVARQYINNFADVFDMLVPWIEDAMNEPPNLLQAIAQVQLRWLAREPDGLIIRKSGMTIATQVQSMAAQAMATPPDVAAVASLDRFLRIDCKHRNPGTTADLIAAALFVWLISRSPVH